MARDLWVVEVTDCKCCNKFHTFGPYLTHEQARKECKLHTRGAVRKRGPYNDRDLVNHILSQANVTYSVASIAYNNHMSHVPPLHLVIPVAVELFAAHRPESTLSNMMHVFVSVMQATKEERKRVRTPEDE